MPGQYLWLIRAFNWLKCMSGYLHLKPTVGCQISTLIFEFCFVEGGLYEYPWKINLGRQSSFPLEVSIKGIGGAFNWLKFLGASKKKNSNIKVNIWHPAVGLRCRNPLRHFSQLKCPENTFELNPKWARYLPSLIYFSNFDIWIFFFWGGGSINILWKIY
jgi:hypothetical protein